VRGEEPQALPESNECSRCRGLGVPLNAPEQMQTQEAMRGNRDEGMKNTSNNINPHKT